MPFKDLYPFILVAGILLLFAAALWQRLRTRPPGKALDLSRAIDDRPAPPPVVDQGVAFGRAPTGFPTPGTPGGQPPTGAREVARVIAGVSARLVPQVPIRHGEPPPGWFGGAPKMTGEWPVHDGKPMLFLVQLDLAALPPELWWGLGPRDGSLSIFIDEEDYKVRVIHSLGGDARRPIPPNRDDSVFRLPHRLRSEWPGLARHAVPRWPFDVLRVEPGASDPGGEPRALRRDPYDLAEPAHRPFDWASTLMMLEIVARRTAARAEQDARSAVEAPAQAEAARERLARFEAQAEPPAELDRFRETVRNLPALIEARQRLAAMNQAAASQVARIAAVARAAPATREATGHDIAAVVEGLRAIPWGTFQHLGPEARGADGLGFRLSTASLTAHDGRASVWLDDFEALRHDWARHAYAAGRDGLPAAVREHYEPRWRKDAAHAMAAMGHTPERYVPGLDLETDVVLLELPGNPLLSWEFGDVDHLVLTIGKADLSAGRFDHAKLSFTN